MNEPADPNSILQSTDPKDRVKEYHEKVYERRKKIHKKQVEKKKTE